MSISSLLITLTDWGWRGTGSVYSMYSINQNRWCICFSYIVGRKVFLYTVCQISTAEDWKAVICFSSIFPNTSVFHETKMQEKQWTYGKVIDMNSAWETSWVYTHQPSFDFRDNTWTSLDCLHCDKCCLEVCVSFLDHFSFTAKSVIIRPE